MKFGTSGLLLCALLAFGEIEVGLRHSLGQREELLSSAPAEILLSLGSVRTEDLDVGQP